VEGFGRRELFYQGIFDDTLRPSLFLLKNPVKPPYDYLRDIEGVSGAT
jgi:hypothetical protein